MHLEPVKGLIFPQEMGDTEEGIALYKRSHGSYGPGEQRRRDYNWNIDPAKTRFGSKGDNIAFNGVSQNIAMVLNGAANEDKNAVVNTKMVIIFLINITVLKSNIISVHAGRRFS